MDNAPQLIIFFVPLSRVNALRLRVASRALDKCCRGSRPAGYGKRLISAKFGHINGKTAKGNPPSDAFAPDGGFLTSFVPPLPPLTPIIANATTTTKVRLYHQLGFCSGLSLLRSMATV